MLSRWRPRYVRAGGRMQPIPVAILGATGMVGSGWWRRSSSTRSSA